MVVITSENDASVYTVDMNFKNYDILSNLVLGYILLMALLPLIGLTFEWKASIAYLSIAYVVGYMLNAIGSWVEGFYYWTIGGKPSDVLLTMEMNRKKCSGHSRVKFYQAEAVIQSLKAELKDDNASTGKMFALAMQYSNSDEKTRVPDFNAQYAFARTLLTTMIILSPLILIQYDFELKAWLILLPLFISWYRYKDRAYYYAREVLIEYFNKKSVNN